MVKREQITEDGVIETIVETGEVEQETLIMNEMEGEVEQEESVDDPEKTKKKKKYKKKPPKPKKPKPGQVSKLVISEEKICIKWDSIPCHMYITPRKMCMDILLPAYGYVSCNRIPLDANFFHSIFFSKHFSHVNFETSRYT